MRKQHLAIEIYIIVRKHCKVIKLSVFSHFLAKSCNFEVNAQIACLIMMAS